MKLVNITVDGEDLCIMCPNEVYYYLKEGPQEIFSDSEEFLFFQTVYPDMWEWILKEISGKINQG